MELELNSDIITIFNLILTGVLVGAVILTYSHSVKQYKTVNRPWLVFGGGDDTVVDHWFHFYLENIGNLPAEKIVIESSGIFHGSNREDKTDKRTSDKPTKIGLIMPKQKAQFIIVYLAVDDVVGCSSYSVDVLVTYCFGKDKKMCKFQLFVELDTHTRVITCVEAD